MARQTREHGIAFVLSSFVTFTGPEVDPRDLRLKPWYPLTPVELGRIYRYMNDRSREVAAEFRLPYVDAAARFPKDTRYFPFDIFHLSPEGNQLLASLFADVLSGRILPAILDSKGFSSDSRRRR